MKKLSVRSTVNGYHMTVDDSEYFYFSLAKLCMGIAQHCCETQVDNENCVLFANALTNGEPPTVTFNKMIKEQERIKIEYLRRLDAKREEWKEEQKARKAAERKVEKLELIVEQLKEELKNGKDSIEGVDNAQ